MKKMLNSNLLILLNLFLVIVVFTRPVHTRTYFGYSLYRVTPKTQDQLQYLLKVNANSSIGLDFWLRTTAVNKSADVMVAPRAKSFFRKDLREREIPYVVMIQDLGKVIRDDDAAPVRDRSSGFFGQYNKFENVMQFVMQLADLYPGIVSAIEIGRSFENRPLILLKVSSSDRPKPAIWIQGGAHARELIGPATVVYIALQLLTLSEEDSRISDIIDEFDLYILPILNPDGYEYALTKDRLWRKTRSRHPQNRKCIGVDANRNWDFHWSESAGSSKDPCSQNYAGPKAFSEPETRAVSQYISSYLNGSFLLFLDMHSYSQRWLTPWGYTTKLPSNYREQKRLAEVCTAALKKVYGTNYSVGSSAGTLYTVSGGARDWMHGAVGAQYSYVVELRDSGNYGFVLPKAQILPTAVETWAGVREMICDLLKKQKQKRKNSTTITTDDRPSTTDDPNAGGFAYGIAVFWQS